MSARMTYFDVRQLGATLFEIGRILMGNRTQTWTLIRCCEFGLDWNGTNMRIVGWRSRQSFIDRTTLG